MHLPISTPQIRTVFQRILEFIVGVIVFLLLMVFALWLMTALEPRHFATWFLS